ncbi:MAG: iron complex transport system substrate-binding protein [Chthoniobacter sp.]|jgi:iron complex transport system substrate-binding protein|nr:iron complex transport system substrate-binding protein [Chthoniobacter sp.]
MRIVCLSAEAADICARIGAWPEVVAVSAFAPQEGLDPRPVAGGFSTGDCERVAGFAPDLVITFSDVQADLTAQLVRAGCAVLATNQRSLTEIAQTIRLIGGAVGRTREAAQLADEFSDALDALRCAAEPRPCVYFEEWFDPMISGIAWVGELIELCGGIDLFRSRRGKAARERRLDSGEVIAANPDIILASWCGKPVNLDAIRRRPGFDAIKAVRDDEVHALDSDVILQPGPRVLEGAGVMRRLFDGWRARCAVA